MPGWLPIASLGIVFSVAVVSDLRDRTVVAWPVYCVIGAGLVAALVSGQDALVASLAGVGIGLLVLLAGLLTGGMGAADALLIAAIGAWEGWHFTLVALWWTAVAGAVIALIALRLRRREFPYVPAIAVGLAITMAMH